MADEQITVRHDAPASRYEILVGDVLAGFADHRDSGDVREFPHTVVQPEFGGRGLAGHMIAHALDEARADGMRVKPTCPFVARYIDKHPEYADLVA